MSSLQDLPPLPKSLSGLLDFSTAQWKEMEKLHTLRQMIQRDLVDQQNALLKDSASASRQLEDTPSGRLSIDAPARSRATPTRNLPGSQLDGQLALLRKEMVGLRQMDMSLLCQLWTLNESIQDYKQMVQDRTAAILSQTSWNPASNGGSFGNSGHSSQKSGRSFIPFRKSSSKIQRGMNSMREEQFSSTSGSSSNSSVSSEYGNM